MRVILAESAGFCYGVHRAVDLARAAAKEYGRCWMLGDLIHNAHVVEELRSAGIEKTEDPDALRSGDTVILRSHGERRDVLEALAAKGVRMVDAACPNVTRIQKLAAKAGEEGRTFVLIGEARHPEVMAIASYCPGTVVLDGQDITNMPDYRRSKCIGRLFQDPLRGTAPSMTIAENLALAYLRAGHGRSPFSTITKKDRAEFRDRLAALELGLEDRMNHPVGLLSGGQRQALTLLMATLVTPKLLLLDEHTAALDPATAEKVLELTKKIVAENHITCLMITHNVPSALALGNRTVMMKDGRIVLELAGARRANMTPEDLLKAFHVESDRMLFSAE